MVSLTEAWNWLVELVSSSLSDIALAAIILFSGLVLARVASLLIDSGLRTLKLNEALKKGFSIPFNVSGLISQFVLYAISIVTVLWALRVIGINAFVVTALSVFAIIVIAFSVVLALRDLVPNLIAGVEIRRKALFSEGDTISYDGDTARVLEEGLFETILEQETVRIVVPNAILLRHEIIVEGATHPIGSKTQGSDAEPDAQDADEPDTSTEPTSEAEEPPKRSG